MGMISIEEHRHEHTEEHAPSRQGHVETLLVPQLGEGLRQVRVLALLKQPGERIALDEPLYQIETDKANVVIESSFEGVLHQWLAEEGDYVAVHGVVGYMEVAAVDKSGSADKIGGLCPSVLPRVIHPDNNGNGNGNGNGHAPHPAAAATPLRIPPRTRALCARHGLGETVMARIPSRTGTLSEEDVLRFLEKNAAENSEDNAAKNSGRNMPEAKPRVCAFEDLPLSLRQQAFNRTALQGAIDRPLPALIRRPLAWEIVIGAQTQAQHRYPDLHPSLFQLMAYAVTLAAAEHPKFRSSLIEGGTKVRRYAQVNLGFAVPLPDDELTTAVVTAADTLDLPTFTRTMRAQMRRARKGEMQVDATTTLLLSSLAQYGITEAVPVLVPPAIAVLFLGAPGGEAGAQTANLTLAFDHRLINGVGAAQFLEAIESQITKLGRAGESSKGS